MEVQTSFVFRRRIQELSGEISWRGKRRANFILSFPRSSTGKSHPPQFLHKGAIFFCCRASKSAGELGSAKNVGLPELAE